MTARPMTPRPNTATVEPSFTFAVFLTAPQPAEQRDGRSCVDAGHARKQCERIALISLQARTALALLRRNAQTLAVTLQPINITVGHLQGRCACLC